MTLKPLFHRLNRRDTRLIPKFKFSFSLIISAVLVLSTLFSIKIRAQQANVLKETKDAWTQGGNMETWVGQESLKATTVGLLDTLIDVKGMSDAQLSGQSHTSDGKPIVWIPGGAIGATNNLISSLYAPPASGIDYIASTWDNFLGKPAYAQGIGFQGLQPILPIWRGFRNIVYVLSSLVFIVIGLMIMLRVKISPQAVVTIQNAIPNLITTLILVTFSYAIAGLLIDLSSLIQAVVIAALFNVNSTPLGDNLLKAEGPIGTILQRLGVRQFNYNALADAGIGQMWSLMYLALPKTILFTIAALISVIISLFATPLIGGIAFAIILLVLAIILLSWLLKFFFGLVKCYLTIILKIVLAPIEIGLGVLPGSKMGFSSWMTDLVANLAVFPLSLIFMVVANMISQMASHPLGALSSASTFWTPSILSGGGYLQGITWPSGGLFAVAIGLGALMMLPKLPESIPQIIFQLKPSPWGLALGASYKENLGNTINTATGLSGKAFGRPILDQIGDKLESSTFLNKIRTGRNANSQGLGQAAGGTVKNVKEEIFRTAKKP